MRLYASHEITQSHFVFSTYFTCVNISELFYIYVDYEGSAHLLLHKLHMHPYKMQMESVSECARINCHYCDAVLLTACLC